MIKDDLGNRMKSYYEEVSKTKLVRRMPVIIRIDGKAFHTFTRGMKKPFSDLLISTMQETAQYLCEHIQGCKLAYTQSDEISLLLTDYDTLETSAWFDYGVQKMSSIAASMTTMAFNSFFKENIDHAFISPEEANKIKYGAMFDARCFNLPKEEVTNYFYWRQLDAMRNSVNMVGQAFFSPKQMNGKSVSDVKEMLKAIEHDWEKYTTVQQRGSCVAKQDDKWIVNINIPIFKGEDRKYIDDLLNPKYN